jgi:hypothetical protein
MILRLIMYPAPCRYTALKHTRRSKSLCAHVDHNINLQVMFKVPPASLQTFIDTPNSALVHRVQYTKWSWWLNCLKYFCLFFCTVIITCTEKFWSPCRLNHSLRSSGYNRARVFGKIRERLSAHIFNISISSAVECSVVPQNKSQLFSSW